MAKGFKIPAAQINGKGERVTVRGSTLTGFLLGVGVCLLIAAVVAYFVYQGGSAFKTPDNPNPPSSSLPKPKPAEPKAPETKASEQKTETKAAETKTEPPPKVAASVRPEALDPPPVATASSPAPAKPKVEEVAAVKRPNPNDPPPPPPSSEVKPIFLQAGAFNNKSEAESRRGTLALAGIEGKITEIMKDDKPMYRVRVGPFESPEAATQVRGDLARNGIDAVIIR